LGVLGGLLFRRQHPLHHRHDQDRDWTRRKRPGLEAGSAGVRASLRFLLGRQRNPDRSICQRCMRRGGRAARLQVQLRAISSDWLSGHAADNGHFNGMAPALPRRHTVGLLTDDPAASSAQMMAASVFE
ncbi:unnamed protein product, partial [Ixodes pacificus]